jgi:hypothetical protein
MIPRTSHPEFRASIVAAEITEFIPGAGPPPHKIPSFTPPSFQQQGDPGKRTGPGPQNHARSQIPAARRATARAASIWLVIMRMRSACDNVRLPEVKSGYSTPGG